MKTIAEKIQETFKAIKEKLKIDNPMEAPRVEKVVVSTGVGSLKDKKKTELIVDRLSRITGQKPSFNKAKKSIASFKLREGDVIGYQVTLRGKRMNDFLDKFINIALPRTKDFRGIPVKNIDQMGNLTVGIKEHTIFPETSDEDIRDVFGMSITVVTSVKNKKDAEEFLRYLGIPFVK